jgi:hypothetical protein
MLHNILDSVVCPTFYVSRSAISNVILFINDLLSTATKYSFSCPYPLSLNVYETVLLSVYEELMKQIVITPYIENTTEEYFNFLKASHTIDQVLNIP